MNIKIMQKSKRIHLNIGDSVYKYIPLRGVWDYVVKGKREYEATTLYEVEAQTCRDHEPCRVLITQVDNCAYFEYVGMANNSDIEEDENGYSKPEQYYWHITDNKYKFFTTKNKCLKFAHERLRVDKLEDLEKAKQNVRNIVKSINEIDSLIKGFVDADITTDTGGQNEK